MTVVVPDILGDLCGLSLGPVAVAGAAGLMLWLLGWWSHRFWVVLAATVSAGVFGLFSADARQGQPLVASLLLALAAGMLALALVRLIAFLGGGLAGLTAMQTFAPTVDQPLIAFLVAGLVGLLLFRWCVTLLTSFVGATLLTHAALILLHRQGKIDAPVWAEQKSGLLVAIVLGMTLAGAIVQGITERRRKQREQEEAEVRRPVERRRRREA